MQLASKFRSFTSTRSSYPLSDDEIVRVAPSIFAEDKHQSRSQRYAYIPTSDVLKGLRNEGFQPFMASRHGVRDESRREHTKHMIRLRHATQISDKEANEIILLNSHDGSSSYQMLAGMYRFVCQNGMVCGDTLSDIRIPHKGNIIHDVIEGAFTVLDDFESVNAQLDGMKALTLNQGEQAAFARAALTLKYDDPASPAPITEDQLLSARRFDDRPNDMWTTFSRVQENMIKGGLRGRSRNGRTTTTRAVNGIDQNVKINRALWVLAEEMRKLKA